MSIFTIVTVTKNDLKALLKSRESLENQSFREWNHVIIDGKSQDGTIEFLETLSKENTFFISQVDSGIYEAMNKGWRLSVESSYVLFLNAGDVFASSTALTSAFSALSAGDFPMWGCTTHEEISEDGSTWYSKRVSSPSVRNQLYAYGYRSHQGVVMKKELIELLGGFNLNYKIAADWDLIARALMYVKPLEWNLALIRFELGGFSSQKILEAHMELYEIRKRLLHDSYLDLFLDFIWRGVYLRALGETNFAGKVINFVFVAQKCSVWLIHSLFKPISWLFHNTLDLVGSIYRFCLRKEKTKSSYNKSKMVLIFRRINNFIYFNFEYLVIRIIHKLLRISDLK